MNVARRLLRTPSLSTFTVGRRCALFCSTKQTEELSFAEREKRLAYLQREVREQYSEGKFHDALSAAVDAQTYAEQIYGEEHPVLASCINNTALLNKSLGNYDIAATDFEKAAGIYFRSVGKKHRSTATAFHNLALCYKSIATEETGSKRLETLHQAKETFEEAFDACKAALGEVHPTTALTASGLASALREIALHSTATSKKNTDFLLQAEELLINALESLEKNQGDKEDSLAIATVCNNLALHLKQTQDTERANDATFLYRRAIACRTRLLSPTHPDTLAARHNLAELLLSLGREAEAKEMQEEMLHDMGISEEQN